MARPGTLVTDFRHLPNDIDITGRSLEAFLASIVAAASLDVIEEPEAHIRAPLRCRRRPRRRACPGMILVDRHRGHPEIEWHCSACDFSGVITHWEGSAWDVGASSPAAPAVRDSKTFSFQRVAYNDLNSRQQENFNFTKISARLADFGFTTIRLSDDWNGADFLALHLHGETLKVQLKGRATFMKKYQGKDLWISFPSGDEWYVYPHDALLTQVLPAIGSSESWKEAGLYSFPKLSKQLEAMLEPFKLTK